MFQIDMGAHPLLSDKTALKRIRFACRREGLRWRHALHGSPSATFAAIAELLGYRRLNTKSQTPWPSARPRASNLVSGR